MRPHRSQHCTSVINVGGRKQPRGAGQAEREREWADAVDHAVVRVPEGAVAEVLEHMDATRIHELEAAEVEYDVAPAHGDDLGDGLAQQRGGEVVEVPTGNQDHALPVGADIDAEASMRHGGSIGQRSL